MQSSYGAWGPGALDYAVVLRNFNDAVGFRPEQVATVRYMPSPPPSPMKPARTPAIEFNTACNCDRPTVCSDSESIPNFALLGVSPGPSVGDLVSSDRYKGHTCPGRREDENIEV